jgi:hypothetical protein
VPGGGLLVGVLLDLAKFSDGLSERGQPHEQDQRRGTAVTGEVSVGGDQLRGIPEPVSDVGGGGDAAVLVADGAIKRIGGPSQYPAAKRGGGHPQRVAGSVGGIGGGCRVGGGEDRDLLAGLAVMRAAWSQSWFRSAAVRSGRAAGRPSTAG